MVSSRSSSRPSDRPSDHYDSAPAEVSNPALGAVGYLRYFWRQLTSMRTALLLLLLLAFASVPGSLVPQRSSDPNGVIQFERDNPESFAILDSLQAFSTYTSVWFSSIYLLLFISLIGCIIPRTRHHLAAARAKPPVTPARLERLSSFTTRTSDAPTAELLATAERLLRKQGYRTRVIDGDNPSVSAERGYLRETGNLVFHAALVGMLVAVGIGGGFGYTGQRVIVEGQNFVNVLADYDSFNPGRFFDDSTLEPYRIGLDEFDSEYELENKNAIGQATDYTAFVSTTLDGVAKKSEIKVNEPLRIGDDDVFLLGNGYAPTLTVRDPEGQIVWTDSVPFLPQDANLTSLGVIKVPDGLDKQVGMIGFFYPTVAKLPSGALTSAFPGLLSPTLTLRMYTGDLGLDDGIGRSVYDLDTADLTPIAGQGAEVEALTLEPGDTVEIPGGLGSIELSEVKQFASFDVHHDPSQEWVLIFAMLILGGILTGLFIPRRRVWIKIVEGQAERSIEYAGLARGDDPRLDDAVAAIADAHAPSAVSVPETKVEK